MEKHLSNEIIQPSDLYNHEILSESKFESDYGKLLLSNIFVPDFSNDEKGAIRLNEEFNYIKLFISEKTFQKNGILLSNFIEMNLLHLYLVVDQVLQIELSEVQKLFQILLI